MIYYFSGTGNSYRVAEVLAEKLSTRLISMTSATFADKHVEDGEALGLVFPVYAWGMPKVVRDFIRKNSFRKSNSYIYVVLTCGDDVGRTDDLVRRAISQYGGRVSAVFSVRMRNTYVCLPGFDTDAPAIVEQKEGAFAQRLSHIADAVAERRIVTDHSEVSPGGMPWLKTYLLRPLFNSLLISPRRFHLSKQNLCVKCGKCIKACPLGNIKFSNRYHLVWSDNCTHCLRCYHVCPRHSIRYGAFTGSKGQVSIFPSLLAADKVLAER